jgi:hypothetical protein
MKKRKGVAQMKLTAQQETDVARFLEELRGRVHSRACCVSPSFIIRHVFALQTIFKDTVDTGRCES